MEQLLFPKASQLCQDTDYEVRKAMAKEMPSLIKSLGLKQSRKTIFPEFMELLIDEEASVQQAALKHFMDLAEIFDGECRLSTLIPFWKKICSQHTPKLALIVAELFGQFMWKAKSEQRWPDGRRAERVGQAAVPGVLPHGLGVSRRGLSTTVCLQLSRKSATLNAGHCFGREATELSGL